MVQKKLPLINSAHGSETRNIINEIIKMLNSLGYTYDESLRKAHEILDEAKRTNNMNVSVQTQINTLIAESGTSDAEVLQARTDSDGYEYDILKDRLDNSDDRANVSASILDDLDYNIKLSEDQVTDDNWSKVINDALSEHGSVYIPFSVDVNETINIPYYATLKLGREVTIRRPDKFNNQDPVITLWSQRSKLIGEGMLTSIVTSRVPTPKGVVNLGYEDMQNTNASNKLYNNIFDIGIHGHTAGGNTTGEPSLALSMVSPEVNNLPSYFHNINNVSVGYANAAILMEGYANANIMNNIHIIAAGNEKHLNGGGIIFKETDGKMPLDNVITNIFHHQSNNADTLVFDGGTMFNTITNIVSEQGGSRARWIYEKEDNQKGTPDSNIITGIANTASYLSMSEKMRENNVIIDRKSISLNSVRANRTTSKQSVLGDEDNVVAGSYTVRSLQEGRGYELMRIINKSTARFIPIAIDLTVSLYSPVSFLRGVHSAKIAATITSDTIAANVISSGGTIPIIISPYIKNGELVLGLKVRDNGTGTGNIDALIDYKVLGRDTSVVGFTKERTLIEDDVTTIGV